jgi:hypothetical protein
MNALFCKPARGNLRCGAERHDILYNYSYERTVLWAEETKTNRRR